MAVGVGRGFSIVPVGDGVKDGVDVATSGVGGGVGVAGGGVGEGVNVAGDFVGKAVSVGSVVGVGSEVGEPGSGATAVADSTLSSVVCCLATMVGELTK